MSSDTPGAGLEWSQVDKRAVDLVRVLAMDAVQKAGNGHPGTAMSLAPAAYLLFQRVMRHDPADPDWPGRDRFVLSCGHSSLTLYIQLYLSGTALTLADLEALRTWGSLTPGHPEHWLTPGVEATTGPLGQGIAMAVGMAMAARRERGLLDPDAAPGTSPFDHHIYVFCSDGDIEEGITHEASSLAGPPGARQPGACSTTTTTSPSRTTPTSPSPRTWRPGTRPTAGTCSGSSWRQPGRLRRGRRGAVRGAPGRARPPGAPSFIALRTIIGWPAPNKQNTGAAHGSALGADEVAATKEILGFDPAVNFPVEDEALAPRPPGRRARQAGPRRWNEQFAAWAAANPERQALLDRLSARELPDGWADALPAFEARRQGPGHPHGLRPGAQRAGPGAAGAVGRLGRPGRQQRHHDEGRAVLHPGRPPDQDVPRQPVRPDAALRHPRARHGRDPATASRCTA